MAEESEQDKSQKEFDPTESRLREARKEGNVPQSREANTLALFVGILLACFVLNLFSARTLFSDFSALLYHGDGFAQDVFEGRGLELRKWAISVVVSLSPILAILFAVTLLSLTLQRSIVFSLKKLKPDFRKISPIDHIKNKYGTRGLTDFLKDAIKMLFAVGIGTVFLMQFVQDYYSSANVAEQNLFKFTYDQVFRLVFYFFLFQFVLAAIDLPLQWNLHRNQLKMSREDMKREMKQSEGDPQLKQQRRERATKISRGQTLQNVKVATVLMVNPTHYAVALKWDPNGSRAPVCVAKGVDELALKMREVAIEAGVPVYSDPPATRSIYAMVDVDAEILPEHFAAVAAAIQFVDRLKGRAET